MKSVLNNKENLKTHLVSSEITNHPFPPDTVHVQYHISHLAIKISHAHHTVDSIFLGFFFFSVSPWISVMVVMMVCFASPSTIAPCSRHTACASDIRGFTYKAFKTQRSTRLRPAQTYMQQSPQRPTLEGKTTVITGGHRGIGRTISIALARAGSNVIIIDSKGAGNSDVPSTIQEAGKRHASIIANLADAHDVVAAAASAIQVATQWDTRVSALVNNAGIAHLQSVQSTTLEAWDETMAVNARAPFLLARELAGAQSGMLHNGGGSIVNVSSAAGQSALRLHASYSASKATLEMLTKTMAVEWASHGIRINAIAPTVVFTDMGRRIWDGTDAGRELIKRVPTGRFAEPQEIADVVVFLLSDGAVMINGAVIPIDGGFSAT